MTSAGTHARERFLTAMQAVAVGAKVVRRSVVWTIAESVRRETTIDLLLRHGRRSISVSVFICYSGPDLAGAGLRRHASAPAQRESTEMATRGHRSEAL